MRMGRIGFALSVSLAGAGVVRGQVFPEGACCSVTGTCSIRDSGTCVAQLGVFLGQNTLCDGSCPFGACCQADGSCNQTTQTGCSLTFGSFRGIGVACDQTECVGACCLPDKDCLETGEFGCVLLAGTYAGDGSMCGPDCPVPLSTAFAYQGQLKRAGLPLTGSVRIEFSLWISPDGDRQIGSTVVRDTDVVNGLFTVDIDFGVDAFNGNARWLQVAVCDDCNGSDPTILLPRQALTAVPYALQTRGFVVRDDGRIGIGTKTPVDKVHIDSERQGLLKLSGSSVLGTWLGIVNESSGGRNWSIISTGSANSEGAGRLLFRDNNAGKVRLMADEAGNVGIGTTDPTSTLTVAGDIRSTAGGFVMPDGTVQTKAFRPLTRVISINFGPVPAGAQFSVFVGMTGAVVGSAVLATPLTSLPADIVLTQAYVTSPNSVNVFFRNVGSGTVDPPNMQIRVDVLP